MKLQLPSGLETFKKTVDVAQPGDNLGILLRGVDAKAVRRGMVLLPQSHKHAITDKVEAQVCNIKRFIVFYCYFYFHYSFSFENFLQNFI